MTFYPNSYFVEQLKFFEEIALNGDGDIEDWFEHREKVKADRAVQHLKSIPDTAGTLVFTAETEVREQMRG